MDWRCGSSVAHLLCKCEVLSSNSILEEEEEERSRGRGGGRRITHLQ
jgi:hypothetical protein